MGPQASLCIAEQTHNVAEQLTVVRSQMSVADPILALQLAIRAVAVMQAAPRSKSVAELSALRWLSRAALPERFAVTGVCLMGPHAAQRLLIVAPDMTVAEMVVFLLARIVAQTGIIVQLAMNAVTLVACPLDTLAVLETLIVQLGIFAVALRHALQILEIALQVLHRFPVKRLWLVQTIRMYRICFAMERGL